MCLGCSYFCTGCHREINLNNVVFFWCISPLGWAIALLQTKTGAALQKPDRYNLRFLTETNFIKLKRVTWPQPRPRFKQTFITIQCNCIKYFSFENILFSFSEILTGNCSNLYSKRRHYSCYWTEYLSVEEVTILQLFSFIRPISNPSPLNYGVRIPFLDVPNNLSFLFNLPLTVGVKDAAAGRQAG